MLAVFAHPDDETFRPGGTLALLARRGVKVHVLTATRGQAGSCGDPPLCSQDELPAIRESELRCACSALGLEPPRLLDYQDGHLAEVEAEMIIAKILSIVDQVRPQVMLTFGPEGLSGHLDHIAAGRYTTEAFRRTASVAALYTVAVPRSLAKSLGMVQICPVPDETISLSVNIAETWEAKVSAIRCHATQLAASPILACSTERQRAFLGREYFVRVEFRGERDFLAEWLREA